MADIFARTRHIEGSTAEWVANNLVLGDGELAIERGVGGRPFLRVGNGLLPALSSPSIGEFMEAEAINYTPPGQSVTNVARYLDGRHFPSVKDYGALGDGVNDDTAAIQAAIDENTRVWIPYGDYRVSGLVVHSQVWLMGEGARFWQETGTKPTGANATIIRYNGAAGANTFVVRASQTAVGTRPTYQVNGSQDTFGWKITDVIIDGNNTAHFGLYGARCGLGSFVDNVYLTGCEGHALWATELWSTRWGYVCALHNNGKGVTLGKNLYAWAGSIVNAVHIDFIEAFKNGLANTYNYNTAREEGYGVGLFLARANTFGKIVGELNKGVGCFIDCLSGPNHIQSIYVEDNCLSSLDASFRAYDILVEPSTNGTTAFRIDTVYNKGSTGVFPSSGVHPTIRLMGTAPSNNFAPITVGNNFGGIRMFADWSNYRIESRNPQIYNRLDNFLPAKNDPNTISTAPLTTLYVRSGGTGSGQSSGSALASIQDAVNLAAIFTTVTTINVQSTSLSDQTAYADTFRRRLTILGDATTSIANSGGATIGLDIRNGDFVVNTINTLRRTKVTNSVAAFKSVNFLPNHNGTVDAALLLIASRVSLEASPIDCNSMTTSKRGIELNEDASVTLKTSTISNFDAALAVLIRNGGGTMRTAQALTSANVTIATGEGTIALPASQINSGGTLT